jgi:subtilisin family serine protease
MMKTIKLLMLVALLFIVGVSYGQSTQEYFYYYKSGKYQVELDTRNISISTTEKSPTVFKNTFQNLGMGEMTEIVKDYTRSNVTASDETSKSRSAMETFYLEIETKKNISVTEYFEQINALNKKDEIVIASPVFKTKEGQRLGLSNNFYVKLKGPGDVSKMYEYAKKYNVEVLGFNEYMPLWYTLSVTKDSGFHALEMANIFYESNIFEITEPAFMLHDLQMTSENIAFTFDTFYNNQWGMKNTGQYGAVYEGIDVNAEEAWTIMTSNNIKTAIYDHGFEMNHPDLLGNTFGTGYDANTNSSPAWVRGSHGTACAGITGAVQNNNLGVTGIAPNVDLVSISINLQFSDTPAQLANGFNWARTNGVDVISNSWGGYAPSSIIDNAITDALALGRGGLGCVIVFAAGNENNTNIRYPGNSNPDILVVGAMSPCGERKNPSSCDGEGWGSCFGTELDVVAPGVKMPTTDRQGGAGYSGTDYTQTFNGTSSACPVVAGVASLVLSHDPGLTNIEVNDIIERTAQKTRSDLYAYGNAGGRPNGLWNNEMGYGLVDAYQAQLAAICPSGTTPFDLYSKDRPADTGVEPNPDTGPMWISEDIWVRQNMDNGTTHQNPEFKNFSPNGVYVKVRNRGATASDACARLKVYFTKASTGIIWPTHFNNYYQPVLGNNVLHGDIIGTAIIPSIPAGGEVTVEIPWYPPNPADFQSDIHHFCLISRIVTPNDPMFNEVVGVSANPNSRQNNNIAWKNMSVYDTNIANSPAPQTVFVRGIDPEVNLVNFQFVDEGFLEEIDIPFFDIGEIEIDIHPKLFDRMLRNGSLDGEGIKILDDNKVLVYSRDAVFGKVPLKMGETFNMDFTFNLFKELKEDQEIKFDFVQETLKNEYQGGERFLIVRNKDQKEKAAITDGESGPIASFDIYPNPSDGHYYVKTHHISEGNYAVYDYFGKAVAEGTFDTDIFAVDISRVPTGVYFIKVTTGEEVLTKNLIKK